MASMPSSSRRHGSVTTSSNISTARRMWTRSSRSHGEVQIGGETDRRVPTVRYESRTVLLRHPAYAPLLRDATDLRHVGLHDVEGARLQPRRKRLPSGEDFAPGNRQRR